jgi:peptidoglycan lytic transglycosylase G
MHVSGPEGPDEFDLRAARRRAERDAKRRPRRAERGAPGRSSAGLRHVAVLALGLALVTFLFALLQPFAGTGGSKVRVVIPKSASVGDIGRTLDRSGVIRSAALFDVRATIEGKRGQLKPGVYYLREHSSYGATLDALVSGPSNEFVQLTIPEGLDRRRVAPIAADAGVRGSYLSASSDTSLISLRSYGARGAKSLEGFLFPATYELRRGASADTLVQKQLDAFQQNFASVNLSYARRKNLTPYDVLTIASMIEAEAQLERERPLVAAVIYNRLKQGTPLGIDATTRFETHNWTEPLTKSALAADSPYNTRLNAGLPPGPIGNPGLASIKAAARPAAVDYLYYVVKPGACGEHAFSSNAAQFERDVQRYNAAREANGGKDPQDCP